MITTTVISTTTSLSTRKAAKRSQQEELRMTSLDIAEISGKPHNDVLKAIRKMEPAWVEVTGGNFSLSEYLDPTGRKLPCYLLTKTETLYIATKFKDEMRAKLVLRWEELERERLGDRQQLALPSRGGRGHSDCHAGGQDVQHDNTRLQRRAARHGHTVPSRRAMEPERRSARSRLHGRAHPRELLAERREEDTPLHDVDA